MTETPNTLETTKEDCPFSCSNGKIFNKVTRRMEQCPHCKDIRREEIKSGETSEGDNISEILGFGKGLFSETLVWEALIPDNEKEFIEPESLDQVKEFVETLYGQLSLGEVPRSSSCIGLGIKGNLLKLVYPLLVQAYKNGVKVAPFTSVTEFARKMSRGENIDPWINAELAILLLNEGVSLGDMASAKGVMQMRSVRGRPTIFVTTWTIEAASGLLGYFGSKQLDLAEPIFVNYRRSRGRGGSSRYINHLRGVEEGAVDPRSSRAAVKPTASMRKFEEL